MSVCVCVCLPMDLSISGCRPPHHHWPVVVAPVAPLSEACAARLVRPGRRFLSVCLFARLAVRAGCGRRRRGMQRAARGERRGGRGGQSGRRRRGRSAATAPAVTLRAERTVRANRRTCAGRESGPNGEAEEKFVQSVEVCRNCSRISPSRVRWGDSSKSVNLQTNLGLQLSLKPKAKI